jgi:hypothetical protein
MTNEKKILDLGDINKEFSFLIEQINFLNERFMAISMDYQFYISGKFGNDRIFELRDNINYRLFSAQFHIELLLKHHLEIQQRFQNIYQKAPEKILAEVHPSNPIFDRADEEISSIFDSIVYHLVSVFDYLGTLTNFIFRTKPHDTLTWTSLASSCRDKTNILGKKTFSELISRLDNDFVKKLYNHRSHLIHRSGHINKSNISFKLYDGNFNVAYITTDGFNKNFTDLRKLTKETRITIKFASAWLLQNSLLIISEILFSLKDEMKLNRKSELPMFGIFDDESKTLKPVSENYWRTNEFNSLKSLLKSGKH